MDYNTISADGHVDLIWLPQDLFTANAPAAMKERMPHVIEGDEGPVWVTNKGAFFGLRNGMGSAGRKYVPGQIHRSDRMAETGLYTDGDKNIRRLTEPELRLKDQDLDGVQAEVLYGILGASMRMRDPEAAVVALRIYNDWLSDFCQHSPARLVGLANIPNAPIEAAVEEVHRVAKLPGIRGLDVANSPDMVPLWHPYWEPLWQAAAETGLPVHFHTLGGKREPDEPDLPEIAKRAHFAVYITGFQLPMAFHLMGLLYSGCLERHPDLKVVIGEAGLGWIPYVLDRMDMEWEDQFKDLSLKMKPSAYWRRQCYATYQTDPIGIKLLEELGVDNVMWGSDFPHPDGIWPDSQTYLQRELGHLPADVRGKIVCENARALYRL